MRQDKKRSRRNIKAKTQVRALVKKSQKAIKAEDFPAAASQVRAAIKAIDKAVQNKILKQNAGARKKSQLMKKLNQLGIK